MSAWRDSERIPLGMSDFQRWYRPDGINAKVKHPSDIDGILHNGRTNSFLMLEFKPAGSEITRGQEITMEGFSKLPNCIAILVKDPFWNDDSRTRYDNDQELEILAFKNGTKMKPVTTTVRALNSRIATWFQTGK